MQLWQEGWFWLVIGIGLGVAEVVLPGFILLGFGIGAVLTGALLWLGVLGGSFPVVLLTFAIASGLGWLALRRAFPNRAGKAKIWDRDINDS